MLRLSVSELSTYGWSFDEDVFNYKSAGFEAIGIWLPKLLEFGCEKGRELLSECNLSISSLQCIGGFTGSDGRSYRDCLLQAFDAIQLAADLEAETVIVLAGGRGGHTKNHATRILSSALRELAEAAQAVGVNLALEPMHIGCASSHSFVHTIPECMDIIASIDSPNLGLVFDTYHVAQDSNCFSWLEQVLPFVQLLQLGDAKHAPMGKQNRCLLGEGRIPLTDLVQFFEDCGYAGFCEIELVGKEVERFQYQQILGQSIAAATALSQRG